MPKLSLAKDTTSKLLRVFVPNSSVTTGAGLTGLVFNSAGLTAYYLREGAASPVSITLATMTVGTWASGGFKEVDAANMPGVYELGIPNAALATGANSVVGMLKGATNMSPVAFEIELTEGGGAIKIDSPVKRNTALDNFMFLMLDSSGLAKTGLTVLGQRSLDGASFANCANTPAEVGYGVYKLNLAAADLNAVSVSLRFTAPGARDSVISILTIP
jgi:hypothetical protein